MEKEIIAILADLAKFTKEVSPEVWAIMIKQQYIIALRLVLFFLIFLPLLFYGLLVWKKKPKWSMSTLDHWNDDYEYCIGGFLLTVAPLLISFMLFLVFIKHGISRLLNPAYYVLMDLKPF